MFQYIKHLTLSAIFIVLAGCGGAETIGNENPDRDGDGVFTIHDNCPDTANPTQKDSDGDGIGDSCDSENALDSDGIALHNNDCPNQGDSEVEDSGNTCTDRGDSDSDGIADNKDNCPLQANPDQDDLNLNGIGDACDVGHLKGIVLSIEGDGLIVDQFRHLVEDALAPIGINFILFDVHWGNFIYENSGRVSDLIYDDTALDKDIAIQLSAIAKENNISIGVGINFITHQAWGVLLKAYPEFAWMDINGDPLAADSGTQKPNLWDPLNPGVNPVVFSMVDELIDAFDPTVFHIGLDEPWGFDAANLQSNIEGYSTAELLANSINEFYDYIVTNKSLTMMMWADTLEGEQYYYRGGFPGLIDEIPKDIVLAYWNYEEHSRHQPMWDFAEKGFHVTASPWKDTDAASALLQDAKDLQIQNSNMIGVLYTTWEGDILSDLRSALLGESVDSVEVQNISNVINETINILQ